MLLLQENGLRNDSMLLAETVTQISKDRVLNKIGSITDSKVQNDVLNAYMANITGKKKYNSIWSKIINSLFRLVKEGEYGSAA